MKSLYLSPLLSTASALAKQNTTYPSLAANSTSTVSFTHNPFSSLSSPKVSPINSTVLDWWYFDAVSSSPGDLSSATIIFYAASGKAYIDLNENTTTVLVSDLQGTFHDGTSFGVRNLPVSASVVESGKSGVWGPGHEWSLQGKEVVVSWNDTATGIEGSMRLKGNDAPPHLPCSASLSLGETEEVMPHIGWSNAIVDADATVSFTLPASSASSNSSTASSSNSSSKIELAFEGAGYADKHWSDRPFFESVASGWYKGHARLGPYSIVWFDGLGVDGEEYVSSYLYQHAECSSKYRRHERDWSVRGSAQGQLLSAGCAASTAVVRPWGGNDTYPPPSGSTANPLGFLVEFPDVDGLAFQANVTISAVVLEAKGYYDRWVGSVTGGFVGKEEEQYSGVAQFEQYKYTASEGK